MRRLGENCIIGTVLFDHFVVEIDYLSPAVRLYAMDKYHPAAKAVNVPLTLTADRRPAIDARLVLKSGDTISARLLLDSAIPDYALSLSKDFTEEHRILARVGKVIQPPFQADGTGGKIDLLATRIEHLSVGSIGMDRPLMMLFRTRSGDPASQPDGLIGSGFLHRFLVTIDVPNRRLFLTPNRMYSDPEPRKRWAWALDPESAI
jgi:hypothetical protein